MTANPKLGSVMPQFGVSKSGLFVGQDKKVDLDSSMNYLSKAFILNKVEDALNNPRRLSKDETDAFERLNRMFSAIIKGAKIKLALVQNNPNERWDALFDTGAYAEFNSYSDVITGLKGAAWDSESLNKLLVEFAELKWQAERILSVGKTDGIKAEKLRELKAFTGSMCRTYHNAMLRTSYDEPGSCPW
ncbi:MAG: hypothetical protein KGH60_01270 [Candidatus Micrarchaeota archaeon]|nr:hypothetical protein [Candidatus Micrarchaeota archaeon]